LTFRQHFQKSAAKIAKMCAKRQQTDLAQFDSTQPNSTQSHNKKGPILPPSAIAEGEIQTETPLNPESFLIKSNPTFRVRQRFERISPAAFRLGFHE